MEINFKKHLDDQTLLEHIICHGLAKSASKLQDIVNDPTYNDSGILNITLTVNGHEVDIESFVDHWQSQVKEMIKEKARELVFDKLDDMDDLFYQTKCALQDKLDVDLEDY